GAAIDAFRSGAIHTVDYRENPINSLNKFTDPESAWSYHGARWLAPDTAQWHSPDPPVATPDPAFMITPWSLHPYQYVEQNPVAYWDPDGQQAVPAVEHGEEATQHRTASGEEHQGLVLHLNERLEFTHGALTLVEALKFPTEHAVHHAYEHALETI